MAKKELTGARAAAPAFSEGGGTGILKIDVKSNKTEDTVSIVNSVMTLQYYESILQDSVRASVTYTDTGNTIHERTAMEGLPIVGQETVNLKFSDNNENTIDTLMFVNKVSPIFEDTRTSVVQLNLASREYIWNEKVRVNKRFDGKISEYIKSLLEDEMYLGPTQEAKDAEGYKQKLLILNQLQILRIT